jgi:hypothetical protein
MSAEESLRHAYSEWHRLAEAEGKAICWRDWEFLMECQQALKNLQTRITQLTRETRDEWKKSGADLTAKEKHRHAVVSELIELTRRNQTLLNASRKTAQTRRERIELACRNLKRLQLSYVFARPAAWISYS